MLSLTSIFAANKRWTKESADSGSLAEVPVISGKTELDKKPQ